MGGVKVGIDVLDGGVDVVFPVNECSEIKRV